MLSTGEKVTGKSGRQYLVERSLQERDDGLGGVYLATAGERQKFVLKDIPPWDFEYFYNMQKELSDNNLRTFQDTIPDQAMFVYTYFTDHLLSLAQKDLPTTVTKRILKDTLRGIATLHDKHIVHTDIKANNIMIESNGEGDSIIIDQVQLADLEDAAYVPPGSNIIGKLVGNEIWRSPEAHAKGPVNTPSDIFSFGVVCIYAMTKRLLFYVSDEELGEGEEPLAHIIERQISYFADEDGLNALVKFLGESPWCEIFLVTADGFNESNPRKPYYLWDGIEQDFKDLIGRMTNFDAQKRITAREALAHPWFRDV